MLFGLTVAFVALALDQAGKWFIWQMLLERQATFVISDYFNVVAAFNTGVSFSMLNNGGMWGRVLLSAFALGVVLFLLSWLKNENSKLVKFSLGLIIGGALGNVLDRLMLGAVFDFLDFHYEGYHWPAFNFADTFICVGAVLIIFHTLFLRQKSFVKG